MSAVRWSENIEFPHTCDFCTEGCQCGSSYGLDEDSRSYPGQVGQCNFCLEGCNCEAENDDDLECECECECCNCSCDCELLEIDAKSYNKWIKETCYVCNHACFKKKYLLGDVYEKHCLKKLGNFEFYVRVLPHYYTAYVGGFMGIPGKPVREQAALAITSEGKRNKVCFSGPVFIPMISTPTNDPNEKDRVWMSLTPMEVFSLRPALAQARGRVLIAGLGMGWLTQRVLEKEEVTKVTQVELNLDIINFFGLPLLNKFEEKLEIINDDIWNFINKNKLNNFDTILFDIWPKFEASQYDEKFKKIVKSHPNVWGWGYDD